MGLGNTLNTFLLKDLPRTQLINERDLWIEMLQIDPAVLSERNCVASRDLNFGKKRTQFK